MLFYGAPTEINCFLPVTRGKPFSGEKKVFPGPLSKIRCGISLAAIGEHSLLIVVDEEFAGTFRQGVFKICRFCFLSECPCLLFVVVNEGESRIIEGISFGNS